MKKSLLLTGVLLGLTALSMSAALPKSDYPTGLKIEPAPDSTVDVSGNKSPLGVSAIAFTSSNGDVAKNESNTTPAELYWNDFSVPVATTLSTSIDMETWKTAGVIFPGTWNKNGEYKIVIPEGMFLIGSAKCPAMTLYYDINVGWYPEPANNMVVAELEDIVLNFPDASEVNFTKTFTSSFATRLGDTYPYSYSIDGNRVIFKMAQSGGVSSKLATPGQYMLHIQDGGIEYVQNGVTYETEEIRLTYFIPAAPEPDIYPYVDMNIQDGLEYFELTAPAGFSTESFFLINDRAANNLYRADENGTVDTTLPVLTAKSIWTECMPERGIIYLGLFEPYTGEPLNFEFDKGSDSRPLDSTEWTVVPGTRHPWKPQVGGHFCLLLSQGLYTGNYQSPIAGSSSQLVTSDPYRFYYYIEGNVSDVKEVLNSPETDCVDAYTLTGIRILKNAPKENLNNLPAGIYIVNGKKVIVK